jgi:hypothetical protein
MRQDDAMRAEGRGPFLERPAIVGEKLSASPALASMGGLLHVAWTGRDFRLNLAASADLRTLSGKTTLPDTSWKRVSRSVGGEGPSDTEAVGMAPALAATASGLQLSWTGTDRHVNLMTLRTDAPARIRFDETSLAPPAVSGLGDDVVVAWTGTDRHLNLLQTRDGRWLPPMRLEGRTGDAPAVAAVGDQLGVAWAGTDRHLNLLLSRGGRFGSPSVLAEKSSMVPAICFVGEEAVVAWTGSDRHLNVAVTRGGAIVRKTVIDQTSSVAPALCTHRGEVVLGWGGTDGRLNLARLGLP